VFWIRIGSNADSDPPFYLNADLDRGAKPRRIHADPDLGQALKSQKAEFFHEKYT
jgi:hypothetical protein